MKVLTRKGKALIRSGRVALSPDSSCCGACGGGTTGGPHTGACCDGSTCTIESARTCSENGGTYQGDGTDCSPNPCGPAFGEGACCTSGSCSVTTPSACAGTFLGLGTTCAGVDCTQGACCSSGTCSITTEAGCSGTYMGGGTTCDSPILCGCTCGFSAFDGSGRKFLRYTVVVSGDVTRHERSDCPGSEFDTTEVYTCGGTYRQHYADDCTLITDENSIVSHAAITGTGGGFDCTRADIACFCNSVAPNILCSSMFISCQSCSSGNSGTDTTDTTAVSRTRTVVFSQQCQNDFYCIPPNTHPAICTISGSYTAIETLTDECVPA